MIKKRIYIQKYDWLVSCYIAVSHYDTDDILLDLWRIGCDEGNMYRAEEKLRENALNSGLTYTSNRNRESVMVTALSSDASEQFNTLTHEVCHVCAHIAREEDIDVHSEEFAYLVGDFSMALFPFVKSLLCDCCRTKKR